MVGRSRPQHGLVSIGILRIDAPALTPQPPSPVEPGEGGFGRVVAADRGNDLSDSTSLAALLDRAMAGSAAPLPYRAELERRLGHSLGGIAVHHGPKARTALAKLEARAATRGQHILFAEALPTLAMVAHEVIHALQSRGSSGEGLPRVTPRDAPAEAEAERLAAAIASSAFQPDAPVPVAGELPAGAVALQRSALAEPEMGGVAVAERPESAFAEAAAEQGVVTSEPPAATTETAASGEAAPEAGAEAAVVEPGTAFELPPAPVPGVNPEDVAAREAAIAEAEAILAAVRDVDSLMDAFAAAPPTVKAREQPQLGQRIDALTQQENQQFQEELPEVHAELNAQQEPVEPLAVEAPPPSAVTLEATPPGPAPEPEIPETPELGSFDANDGVARGLNYGQSENPNARASQIGESLQDVTTTDPETPRTAGLPPTIPLGGETDPQRLAEQTSEGFSQARGARDEARGAVLNGPGPEQAQPRQMDEPYAVGALNQPQVAPLAPAEGAQSYLTMGLPPEVQTAFDQEQQAAMQASMAGATGEVRAATETRDQERETAVNNAQVEADRLSQDADQQQRDRVTEARETIQQERQSTLDAQTKAVGDLETNAETRRQADREAIDTRVRDDQEQIDGRYQTADKDIANEVGKGERDAAEEKRKAERDAEEESWWDRAVSFVRDAFNALVSAIDAVFAAVRKAVNGILDAVKSFAIGLIDAAANFIKGAIAAFGEFLKEAIDALLGDIFPELAAKLNAAIDTAVAAAQAAVDVVANGLKSAVSALVDGLKAGLNKILDIYQAALNLAVGLVQAALTGDWSALARKLLEAVLKVAGIAAEVFYGFIGRAEDTFQLILDNPGKFVGNLLDAFLGGVRRFADNFLTHLQAGLIGWLTGALGSGGIVIPERFDLMGVLDLARQILGLTWERLRAKAVKLVGEQNVARLEFVASYIQDLVVKGWSALWERISADVAALREMVLGGIQSFLLERVVVAAITKIASLFNPVGAIVQLVLAAWNLFTFLRDQFQRIAQVVQTVIGAIANIARGILEPATARMETVLAGLLPLAIDLLARLLGLGNVGGKVREILGKVQGFVDRAIDKLLKRVLAMFKGGAGARGPAAEPPTPSVKAQTIDEPFNLSVEKHTLRAVIDGNRVSFQMASNGFEPVARELTNLRIIYTRPGGRYHDSDLGRMLDKKFDAIEEAVHDAARRVATEPNKEKQARLVRGSLKQLDEMLSEVGRPPYNVTERLAPAAEEKLIHNPVKGPADPLGRGPIFYMGNPISQASLNKGSDAGGDPPGWKIIPGAYHRGHLLAKSLGGEGIADNLSPMSKQTNTTKVGVQSHENQVLKAIRFSRDDPEARPPYVFDYAVTARYRAGLTDLDAELAAHLRIPTGAAQRLFDLAETGREFSDASILTALGPLPTTLKLSPREQANLPGNVRRRLAYHYLPHEYVADIQIRQQPIRKDKQVPITAPRVVPNHLGVPLNWE
ncbi:MAG: hypothetical protein K0S78_790 [Thermomicrobiales bacterium]|nr:hypothetical protein [Thermomicrobiales bacterium]